MSKTSHKLDDHDVEQIIQLLIEQQKRKKHWSKVSSPEIARKFGVTTSTIEYIKRNKMRRLYDDEC